MTAKTALSLPDDMLREVDARASQLETSRSAFIQRAIADYLRRLEEADLHRRIEAAYAAPDADDERALRGARRRTAVALREDQG